MFLFSPGLNEMWIDKSNECKTEEMLNGQNTAGRNEYWIRCECYRQVEWMQNLVKILNGQNAARENE